DFGGKIFFWGCVKRFLPPAAAEFSSERRVIFTISRSEILKMTRRSKHNLEKSAVKRLRRQNLLLGLCKKVFAAYGGRIFF
ncbi:MAG: hypothetical protein ACOYOO_12200, partial [Saprospiraceae bacterium]